MRTVTFEGSLHFHVGDDIEILKGIREPDGIRACIIDNLTQGGGPQKSRIDGVFGTFRKEEFNPPIKGKIRDWKQGAGDSVVLTLHDYEMRTTQGHTNLVIPFIRTAMKSGTRNQESEKYEYDISISYASEDGEVAEELERLLSEQGVRVFLDKREGHRLWGKDLAEVFERVYGEKSAYVVVLVSKHYVRKDFTDYEFACALKESSKRGREFILPIKMDDSVKLGLRRSVCYKDFRKESIDSIVADLVKKLRELPDSLLARKPSESKTVDRQSIRIRRKNEQTLEWKDDVCASEPRLVEAGDQVVVPLNLKRGNTLAGTLDEVDSDAFSYYIVNEKNLVECRKHQDFRYEKGGQGDGTYHIKSWKVPRDGPWYLILDAGRMQYDREITVRLRRSVP